jgi:hypothetical protein
MHVYIIESYKDVWKELPPDWLEGLDVKTQIASSKYDKSLNKYKGTYKQSYLHMYKYTHIYKDIKKIKYEIYE